MTPSDSTPATFDPSGVPVVLRWYRGRKDHVHALAEIPEVAAEARAAGRWLARVRCDLDDPVALLDALRPLTDCALDEVWLNGNTIVVAETRDGDPVFVFEGPSPRLPVEILAEASSVNDGGCGPVVWVQTETIYRCGDLYWLEVGGDESRRICVGRFSDPAAGIAAAVDASSAFALDESGEPVSFLDDEWDPEEGDGMSR